MELVQNQLHLLDNVIKIKHEKEKLATERKAKYYTLTGKKGKKKAKKGKKKTLNSQEK